MVVGAWPVCSKCGGRSANDVLGISASSHVVGAGGTFSSTQSTTTLLMYGLGAILLGIAAIFIIGDTIESSR